MARFSVFLIGLILATVTYAASQRNLTGAYCATCENMIQDILDKYPDTSKIEPDVVLVMMQTGCRDYAPKFFVQICVNFVTDANDKLVEALKSGASPKEVCTVAKFC